MPNKTERLGREPITPLLLNLALPSLAGLLISNLYLIFNRIFVGQAVGSLGLAAMNATMPISMIIFAIAILIGRGSSVLYSIALGARKYGEAQKLFGLSMALFLSASLLITVGGLLFLDDLLYFFGATDAVLSYGRSYLSISLLGTLFIMLGFQNNLIRAEGFSGLAMMTQLIGAGLNVVLDYFFVWHFNWGMSGAATATVISQGVSALWVMYFFWSGRSVVSLKWKYIQFFGWKRLYLVLYNGCSPFAINVAGSVIWAVQNRMLVTYGGELAMAAFGIILTVNQFLFTPLFGICMGMQPIIGYNTGAGKYKRVLETFYKSIGLSAIFAIGPYIFVQIFAELVIRLFTDQNQDPELLKIGVYSMRRFLLLMPLGCGTILVSQYFQSIGRAPVALLIAMLRQLLLQLPLTFLLPQFFAYNGVILSGPVSDTLAFVIAFFIMRHELKRLHRLAAREELLKTSRSSHTHEIILNQASGPPAGMIDETAERN